MVTNEQKRSYNNRMNRSMNLVLILRRSRPLFRSISNESNNKTKKYEGIKVKFDENEARLHFDRWIKSLWFAPGGWSESTKDHGIQITRRYIPFWNFTLQGSINVSLRLAEQKTTKFGKSSIPSEQWHSAPIVMNNVSLINMNVYASQTLDRYHLNQLNISFNQNSIVNLFNEEDSIEQWTVDKDTSFQIGWDMNVVPHIKQLAIQRAQQIYPQYSNYQIESFHFNILKKTERLLYYPIYIINYQYGSQTNFTCLVDGLTGQVQGDRQYSMIKVTLATLIAFYPMALITIITLGSMIDPSVGIALASLLSFQTSIPIACIIAPLVGLYAKYYPKIYRERIYRKQWHNYTSNSYQFTYDFTSPFQQQYQSYRQQQYKQQDQQQQQRSKESTSRKRKEEEVPMDLYNLLSISQTATDKEIKRAYLTKAKELHPDRNPGDKKAEEAFKRVNQAYAILSDKFKREQYDKYGYESVKYN